MENKIILSLKNKQLKTILNSKEYKKLIGILTNDVISAAKRAPNEATIESRFDTEISILFDKLFKDLGFTYFPIKEKAIDTRRCISKGRADTSIGALIIEYKHVSKLTTPKQKQEAIEQALDYLDGFNNSNLTKAVAFITDGYKGAFITYVNNKPHIEPFVNLNSKVIDRLIRTIIGLSQKGLNAKNLVNDFCDSELSTMSVSKRLSIKLFNILTEKPSHKTKMLIDEWKQLFKLAHDDQSKQQAIINRRKALEEYFNRELTTIDEQYNSLFALQTMYAIVVKIVAFKVVSNLRYGKDLIDFEQVSNYDSLALKNVFQDLEEGTIFRQYGILNLLEGDFFSWYSADNQWDFELYEIIKEMIIILVKYSDIEIYSDKIKAQDFFKDLYVTMMPEAVRHSLGEYYTKHWLAEVVIDNCLANIDNKTDWRGIDPCCGSGTFLTVMINKIYDENKELPNSLLLSEILTRVVGIDLNPVTVLTARVNYFLNIANLIEDNEEIEIPVYLGDAAYAPELKKIDNVDCLNYVINTKLHPIDINLPKSATNNLLEFFKTMTNIEYSIKTLDEVSVANSFKKIVPDEELTDKIIFEIENLSKQLVDLERNGWNGIWSRIITNYLATASIGKFDIVVSNPPWIDWKNLPSNYRNKIKNLCISRQLFSGDGMTGGINLNICALISNVAAENWLKEDGILGFLMPKPLLFQQSYEGYRNFYLSNGKRLYFQFIDDWTRAGSPFKPVTQKFLSYYISYNKVNYETSIPVNKYIIKKGKKSYENEYIEIDEYFYIERGLAAQVHEQKSMFTYIDTVQEAASLRKIAGISSYIGREGVEVYPQELLIFTVVDDMKESESMVTVRNIQNPRSKYHVPQRYHYFEKKMLHPLVKGIDIQRFKLNYSNLVVPFPYDDEIKGKTPIKLAKLKKIAPSLAKFYLNSKTILDSQNSYSDKIINDSDADFYALARVGNYTFAENFVAYRDNSKWGACVVTSLEMPWGERVRPIFQNHAPYISQNENGEYITFDEAHYICAVLNSPIVAKYILNSSDSRSFPVRPRIKLPIFEPNNPVHVRLSALSKEAHQCYDDQKRMEEIDRELDELYLSIV